MSFWVQLFLMESFTQKFWNSSLYLGVVMNCRAVALVKNLLLKIFTVLDKQLDDFVNSLLCWNNELKLLVPWTHCPNTFMNVKFLLPIINEIYNIGNLSTVIDTFNLIFNFLIKMWLTISWVASYSADWYLEV